MVKPQEKAINLILVEATIPQDMADLWRHSGCRYTLQNTELQSACNELSWLFPAPWMVIDMLLDVAPNRNSREACMHHTESVSALAKAICISQTSSLTIVCS
jgi:hypothetical protein